MGNIGPKFSHLLTVRAEGADPQPPYGQPDRKKTVFFFDDRPYQECGIYEAFADSAVAKSNMMMSQWTELGFHWDWISTKKVLLNFNSCHMLGLENGCGWTLEYAGGSKSSQIVAGKGWIWENNLSAWWKVVLELALDPNGSRCRRAWKRYFLLLKKSFRSLDSGMWGDWKSPQPYFAFRFWGWQREAFECQKCSFF